MSKILTRIIENVISEQNISKFFISYEMYTVCIMLHYVAHFKKYAFNNNNIF